MSDVKPFFCFIFDRWQRVPCGHKGCARLTTNKDALRRVVGKKR